ncbi:hypothetical protein GU926_08035 [Nibribacter ruber]|uniref:Uncharacterized protein n=1 Tax=Nibribacter ruber TaxID=2698458 RepID=A0A6P1NZ54_9BACT|nr:hypothetical protein [Nibribacter ruber]QHL87385.1 hypothetical protein GU926_08035 [Nibribacter ruber]
MLENKTPTGGAGVLFIPDKWDYASVFRFWAVFQKTAQKRVPCFVSFALLLGLN